MKKNWWRKNRRWIFLIIAAAIAAVYIVTSAVSLHSHGEKPNSANIQELYSDRSQIIVTGKDYSLEEEDAEKYIEEQEEIQQETEPEDPKEKPAESIVKEDETQPDQEPETGDQQPGPGDGPGPGEGDGPGGDDDGKEEESKPDKESKLPKIEHTIQDTPYGSNIVFQVRGTDYKGRVIDAFYYEVTLDGFRLSSVEISGDGWVSYRADGLEEGAHSIVIKIKDKDGNTSTQEAVLNVEEAQDVKIDSYVTLTVEAEALGFGTLLQVTDSIYKDESAAHFVKRVLEANGFTPSIDNASSYLSRIYKAGIKPGPATVPEKIQEFLGEPYDDFDPDSLGERDYYATSGWIYLVNGAYMGVGMYGTTLQDGDEIHLGFAPSGGDEYNGNVYNYGDW